MTKDLEKAIEEFLERHEEVKVVIVENYSMRVLYDNSRNILFIRKGTYFVKNSSKG